MRQTRNSLPHLASIATILILVGVAGPSCAQPGWPNSLYRYDRHRICSFDASSLLAQKQHGLEFLLEDGSPVLGIIQKRISTGEPTGRTCYWYPSTGYKAVQTFVYPDDSITCFWSNEGVLVGAVSTQSLKLLDRNSDRWPGDQSQPTAPWLPGEPWTPRPIPAIPGCTFLLENVQGYLEYRHEQTGISLISLPGGAVLHGEHGRTAGPSKTRPLTASVGPFLISKYEVTFATWRSILGEAHDKGRLATLVEAVSKDASLVVINAGRKRGVQVGMELEIWRNEESISKARVTKITDDMAGARILWTKAGSVEVGDQALVPLDGGRG